MRQIAIFVEGQSELIFVRHLLLTMLDPTSIGIECWALRGDRMTPVPYPYGGRYREMFFLIVDVGNDEKVLSAIREREPKLLEQGYEKIIGLRDMYSGEYERRARGVIDHAVIQEFVRGAATTIRSMNDPGKVRLHFSVMEFEAWLLVMHSIFTKMNSKLTNQYMHGKLGYDLAKVDPEVEFYRPSRNVREIFKLVGKEYDKKKKNLETLCSYIEVSDIEQAIASGKCSRFRAFCEELQNLVA